jgi:hypothetical protein
MKTISSKSNSFLGLLAAGLFVMSTVMLSCSKDNNDNNSQMYTTTGSASGSQESPAVNTTATGTLTGTYNAVTNNWNYTINWSGLAGTATLVELRGPASAGVNGNLVTSLAITTPGASGSASGSITLTEAQETALLANQLYYNVINSSYVNGEVRGQITSTIQ